MIPVTFDPGVTGLPIGIDSGDLPTALIEPPFLIFWCALKGINRPFII